MSIVDHIDASQVTVTCTHAPVHMILLCALTAKMTHDATSHTGNSALVPVDSEIEVTAMWSMCQEYCW